MNLAAALLVAAGLSLATSTAGPLVQNYLVFDLGVLALLGSACVHRALGAGAPRWRVGQAGLVRLVAARYANPSALAALNDQLTRSGYLSVQDLRRARHINAEPSVHSIRRPQRFSRLADAVTVMPTVSTLWPMARRTA